MSTMRGIKAYFGSLLKTEHRPELAFLVFGTIFGLLFIFLLPPMQGPDEPAHSYRSYQISHGVIFAHQVGQSEGGDVPVGLVRLAQVGLGVTPPGSIDDKYTAGDMHTAWNVKRDTTLVPAGFSNTAVYSPIAYLPRLPAIWLADVFKVRPVVMLYMLRLSGLLFALPIILFALRIMPTAKTVMAVICLLPMFIMQLSVVSADTVMLCMICLSVALVTRLVVQQRTPVLLDLLAPTAAITLAVLAKPTVLPIAAILLLLAGRKDLTRRKVLVWIIGAGLAILVVAVAWNLLIKSIALQGYQADFANTNYAQQLAFITHHPIKAMRVVYETYLSVKGNDIPFQMLGKFGWLDTAIPSVFGILAFVLIGTAVLITGWGETIVLARWQRLVMAATSIGIILAGTLSEYLYASPVREKYVIGVQGRYLLPALLLMVIALSASKHKLISAKLLRGYYGRIIIGSGLFLLIGSIVLITRFYSIPVLL